VVGQHVPEAAPFDSGGEHPEELVDPHDTPEVPRPVVYPLATFVIEVVAGTDESQGIESVQAHAAGRADVEAAAVVVDPVGEVHLDPAESVHDVLEAVEVQIDEVVDGDPEVLLYHRHELTRA